MSEKKKKKEFGLIKALEKRDKGKDKSKRIVNVIKKKGSKGLGERLLERSNTHNKKY